MSCPSRVRGILTGVTGVSQVSTDQDKLQASFTYDDSKVKLEAILEALDKESRGRYRASLNKPNSKKP